MGIPSRTGSRSLARPGRNVTGLSTLAPELVGKPLQLLKETVPGISRVAMLWNPTVTSQAGGSMFFAERSRIAELAAQSRLPAIYGVRYFAEAGGLMAYGPSPRERWRRAATHVDKMLKGAKPADLPVEQPTKFELVIKLKTAKALGLTIPPSPLLRADEAIQ